jgi:hypothetical protein
MKYETEVKVEVIAALRALSEVARREIGYRLHLLQQNFSGDVKKLKGEQERVSPARWQPAAAF